MRLKTRCAQARGISCSRVRSQRRKGSGARLVRWLKHETRWVKVAVCAVSGVVWSWDRRCGAEFGKGTFWIGGLVSSGGGRGCCDCDHCVEASGRGVSLKATRRLLGQADLVSDVFDWHRCRRCARLWRRSAAGAGMFVHVPHLPLGGTRDRVSVARVSAAGESRRVQGLWL
jgi:hypothetical protein